MSFLVFIFSSEELTELPRGSSAFLLFSAYLVLYHQFWFSFCSHFYSERKVTAVYWSFPLWFLIGQAAVLSEYHVGYYDIRSVESLEKRPACVNTRKKNKGKLRASTVSMSVEVRQKMDRPKRNKEQSNIETQVAADKPNQYNRKTDKFDLTWRANKRLEN